MAHSRRTPAHGAQQAEATESAQQQKCRRGQGNYLEVTEGARGTDGPTCVVDGALEDAVPSAADAEAEAYDRGF
jgi:hypothetical protein